MNNRLIICFAIYFVIVNISAVILTVSDKSRAKNGKWRISEKLLLLAAILGGGLVELLTMKFIRHKTRKPIFMVGLPLIIFLHIFIIAVILISKVA